MTEYFNITKPLNSDSTIYACKKCDARWAYPSERIISIAASLTLLNHAHSHDEPREENSEESS